MDSIMLDKKKKEILVLKKEAAVSFNDKEKYSLLMNSIKEKTKELRNMLCPYNLIEWMEKQAINLQGDFDINSANVHIMGKISNPFNSDIDFPQKKEINVISPSWEEFNNQYLVEIAYHLGKKKLIFSPGRGKGNNDMERVFDMFYTDLSELDYNWDNFNKQIYKYV